MKFSDFLNILFVSYLPIIIFIGSLILSLRKSVKEKKKKNRDKYRNSKENINLSKKHNKKSNRDAFERSRSNFKNFSDRVESLYEKNEEKNLNDKKAKKISENNNKSYKEKVDKVKRGNEKNPNQTPLSEIPLVEDEKSNKNFDDDFYDFDSEKVADIFIYKEIFDKPLSLR